MKNTTRLALLSVALASGLYAAPFLAIGDGAELFVTGTLGVRADDNVLLASKNEQNDIIFDLNPGVELTFGKGAQLKGSLTLVDAFANYSDNSSLNTNLFSGEFDSHFDDGKLKLGFNLSYKELNQNTVGVRSLTRRDVFSVAANTEVEVSQITSVGAGVAFAHENFKPRGYTDSDSLTIPVDFYYRWTPKIDLSFGYRYRDYQVQIGQDSTDHYFNVGARGEFSPKFTGQFSVGVNTRKLSNGTNDTQIGLDANFGYEISPKTTLQFGASNDFGTNALGQQEKNFILHGMVFTKLTAEWSANAGLSYRSIDYIKRTDDYYQGELGATYVVNANVRISGAYIYRSLTSASATIEFTNNIFSLSANFRY